MAPEKDGSRTRRKTSAGRGDSERVGHTVEKEAEPARDITMVDIDPWGSFFEKFWGQAAEDASADRHDGGRQSAKAKQGRSPRASHGADQKA
jgi:hypothetical protein